MITFSQNNSYFYLSVFGFVDLQFEFVALLTEWDIRCPYTLCAYAVYFIFISVCICVQNVCV